MEGSGANYNVIIGTNIDGVKTRVPVLASLDIVEIGGWTFSRSDLLLAMGVNDRSQGEQFVAIEDTMLITVIDPAQEDSGGGGR